MLTELDRNYWVVGPVVNMAAAGNANAVAAYRVSNSALQNGVKSFKVKKMMIRDNGTGGTFVNVGIGAAGAVVNVMPTFQTVTAMDNEWTEVEIPDYEFFGDMMVYPNAVGASTLDIQVTVEEIG
jgi:hypothetical protein